MDSSASTTLLDEEKTVLQPGNDLTMESTAALLGAPDEVKTEEEEAPKPPPRNPKQCGVCHTQPGKYKCPRCQMPYCSVPCSKTHKENHPPDPPPLEPKPEPTPSSRPPKPEPFAVLLDHLPDIQRLLAKYPNLPTVLTAIERKTHPPTDIPPTEPSGLPTKYIPGGVNSQRKQSEQWTRQVGLKKGVAALRQARIDPGEDGDGVREFCELIHHLLNKEREERAADLTAVTRESVVAEETEVIRALIKEDQV